MKIAPTERKWMRLAVLVALLTLAAITPLQTTYADEPEGIDVIVTSDGKTFRAESAGTGFSPPFAGSGIETFSSSDAIPLGGKVMQFGNRTETVIQPDGRTQVTDTAKFPNRAIASLVLTFPDGQYLCTGWFIGPKALATAGHCVYDPVSQQFATSITVYPGRNGNTLPYGQAQSVKLFTNSCWIVTQNPKCDYGGIRIDKKLGKQTGWLGFGWTPNNQQLLDRNMSVLGYPGDKPPGTLWTMKGPLQVVTKKQIGYSMDTFGGQSGSPVFGNPYFVGSRCTTCSTGIHAYGFNPSDPQPPFYARNSGTRITEKVFNALCTWRGGCYQPTVQE